MNDESMLPEHTGIMTHDYDHPEPINRDWNGSRQKTIFQMTLTKMLIGTN